MTTTRFIRPTNLWAYLDAGRKLSEVLPKRARLLGDVLVDWHLSSVAERRRRAAIERASVEDFLEHGNAGRFAVPRADGAERSDAEIQECIWLDSFEADLFETDDPRMAERLLNLLPAAVIESTRQHLAERRRWAPLTVTEPDGTGWVCDNCGTVHEPGATAMEVAAQDGDVLHFCVGCVTLAALAMVPTSGEVPPAA